MMADLITDPHIRKLMAELNPNSNFLGGDSARGDSVSPTKSQKPIKPPQNFNEFLAAERLSEWPQRLTSENPPDLDNEKALLGNKDDILKELKDATPVDLKFLGDLESRLSNLTKQLGKFADRILVAPVTEEAPQRLAVMGSKESSSMALVPMDSDNAQKKPPMKKKMSLQVNKAFITDLQESDMLRVHPSRKKGKRTMDFKESLIETKKRGVESCIFPGFRSTELTELPGQLEAPQILNRVTKAQDFNPGMKKFWKKIFQSEASIAVMQDTFWWIFLSYFEKNNEKRVKNEQNLLFDRIADSFVALFTSINPEIKDKFFAVYSDCLAQAVFAAFHEAFPESDRNFQDDFKQHLVSTISEWVSGFPPPPQSWKTWRVDRLESKAQKKSEDSQSAAKSMMDMSANKDKPATLELDDFMKMVNRLGEKNSSRVGSTLNAAMSRDASKAPSNANIGPVASISHQPVTMTLSRQAQCGTPRRVPNEGEIQVIQHGMTTIESHSVGPGPEMERVLFNIKGQSPLVAHYLQMRQLRGKEQPGRRVRRTHITKQAPGKTTYRELINESKTFSLSLSKEYQKVCEQTNQEIAKIERSQRDLNAEIDRLKHDLSTMKNPIDVTILSERILDKREQAVIKAAQMGIKGRQHTGASSDVMDIFNDNDTGED